MWAAYCERPGSIAVRQVEDPHPAPGEAVVRVVACGICGSDLHWYGGASPPPPVCPGHEIVGEVAAIGGDSEISVGERVVVEPLRPCGACARCGRGDYHLCGMLRIIGVTDDGGLAEAVRVPIRSLYRLPAGLALSDVVLAEPLAVAIHAARLAGVGEGRRVIVLGAGAIGILSILACRAMGTAEIAATARYPHQADAARRAGADHVFAADREGRHALRALAGERDFDVVLETVGGTAPTLRQAIQVVAPGGCVVLLGLFHGDPPLPAMAALVKEVRIIGSMVYNRAAGASDFERALALIPAEREFMRQLVTHRFPLGSVDAAFRAAADKRGGAIKVLVEP